MSSSVHSNSTAIAVDAYGNTYEVALSEVTQTIRTYGVIIRDEKLLLTKQWDGYSLPGGGVETGESLEQALEREIQEETGLTIKAGQTFYNTFRLFKRNAESDAVQAFMFFYEALSVSGTISNQSITESEKTYTTGKAEWIALSELPSITFRHSVDLNEILNHLPKN